MRMRFIVDIGGGWVDLRIIIYVVECNDGCMRMM